MGRADQTTKIKGMFVHPEQVAELAKRHPEIHRMRLVVDNPGGQDQHGAALRNRGGNEALDKAVVAVCAKSPSCVVTWLSLHQGACPTMAR
jgi:phenylacetate-CoA ligase